MSQSSGWKRRGSSSWLWVPSRELGSQIGVVVATLLVIGLPEAFRELADYRMLAFGMGMVVIMLWRPRGLLAHRDPTILLHGGKKPPPSPGVPAGAARCV